MQPNYCMKNRQDLESILFSNSEKKNLKSFWWYVGRFLGYKSSSSTVFREGTILIEMDVCKAKKFNYIFRSSFEVPGTESSTKN